MRRYYNYLITFKKFYFLFTILVKRDIKKKYKGSFLGILWSLINPLLNMIVLTIVFSTIFKNNIENFPVYLLSGRLLFSFFESATTWSMNSIFSSASLLKKVYVPKYIMTLAGITANFINFLISLLALIIVILFTGADITMSVIYTPLYLVLFFIFVCGISFILSTVTVFFKDVSYIYQVFVQILIYASAIFYPASIIPEKYQIILTLNPIYHYVSGFRQVVYLGLNPDWVNLAICTMLAGLSMTIGAIVFAKNQDKFILHI